ncbi:MAG: hypothetical protein P0Y56_12530 [Candidatus Andeanibacterium colombiense]|uniref:Uncharacterized protein n=1 Tax=Candidatus Andeanibacterium colombiense TaxID=3121345 RepID=A0AAJ5X784_9SPHN|nr:MAG: hypothetical protein P0Y56_12530 [Sphingomonadaceae bacterium]
MTEFRKSCVFGSLSRRLTLAAALSASLLGVAAPAAGEGLFGPGKFTIAQTDDRFSTSPTTAIVGHNNRVTKKSPVGGFYIGPEGFYLDPMVIKTRADGKVVQTGFVVENRTDIDTLYGSPNNLGSLQRVGFLLDGGRLISVPVSAPEQRFSDRVDYNTITRSASSAVYERGMLYLQPADMAALAAAKSVAVQVQGSKQTWTIEERDISKSFLANIRAFYQQQIAG